MITPPAPKPKINEEGEEEPIDEEELAKSKIKTLQKDIYPESVISIECNNQFIKRRSAKLLAEKTSGAEKWEAGKLRGKLDEFNKFNSIDLFKTDDDLYPTTKFF